MKSLSDLACLYAMGFSIVLAGSASASEPTDTSYDELSQTAFMGSTMTLTGNFREDVAALRSLPEENDVRSMLSRPRLIHVSLSADYVRIDDVLRSVSVILKSKNHQATYLDNAKRLYRSVEMPAQMRSPENEQARALAEASSPQFATTTTSAPPRTFEGRTLNGTRTVSTWSPKHNSSCPTEIPMEGSAETISYADASRPQPSSTTEALGILEMGEFDAGFLTSSRLRPGAPARSEHIDPRLLRAAVQSCQVGAGGFITTFGGKQSSGFVFFSSATFQMRSGHIAVDGASLPGMSMTTQAITERSNVRDSALPPALFEIPPGFSAAPIVQPTPVPTITIPIESS